MGEVVITGAGTLSPAGIGASALWSALTEFDRSLFTPRRAAPGDRVWDAGLEARVPRFEPARWIEARLALQTDIATQYALCATSLALAQAGIDSRCAQPFETGVFIASAAGGFEFTLAEFGNLWRKGARAVSVYESFAWFYAAHNGQASIRHGVKGDGLTFVGESPAGLDGLAAAVSAIQAGLGRAICGGMDACRDPWSWQALVQSGLVTRRENPDRAYLPFTTDAAGFIPADGGTILVLESAEGAAARGVEPLGSIKGHASGFSPFGSNDDSLSDIIRSALEAARTPACEIDLIMADGQANPIADDAETDALSSLFGRSGHPPVACPKARFGRMLSGGGTTDLLLGLLSARTGVIPGTYSDTDLSSRTDLAIVRRTTRGRRLRTVLVLARDSHGLASALVATTNQPRRRPT
ncbi:MAG: hypothetical protein LBJ44_06690 [Propionibacteriaceae bacterium]|jgi:act minimal PKS chain-length factor (CLF/KS beta)|nr:hypothetical protein [Propionibacteriaceae bacterium]